MRTFAYTAVVGSKKGCAFVNRFINTSGVAVVTLTDRSKSVGNRFVIKGFGGVFVLSHCFLDFSGCVMALVIGLGQVSPFFLCHTIERDLVSHSFVVTDVAMVRLWTPGPVPIEVS